VSVIYLQALSVSVNWHTLDGSQVWTGAASTVVANYPTPAVGSSAASAAPAQNNAALAATYTGTTQPGSLQETSWKFDITYTGPIFGQSNDDAGTVVTNGTENVHAGWPIQLGAALAPADLATKFTWKISGAGGNGSAAINGYVSNQTTGAPVVRGKPSETGQAYVVTLAPANDTKATFPDPSSPGILKRYYYTETKNLTASVQPQGANIPAVITTFDVTAPTTPMKAVYQFPTRKATAPGATVADDLYLGAVPGTISTPAQAGIVFTHPAVHNTTFQGSSYFIQTFTANDKWTGIAPTGNFSESPAGCDNTDPYPHIANNNDEAVDAPYNPTDAVDQINYSQMSIDEAFTMWVMYHPKMAGAIDVPLELCTWKFAGTATATFIAKTNTWATPWILTGQSPTLNAGILPTLTPVAAQKYPTWLVRPAITLPPN
ncbi:MAG: hypothetical protein ACP5O1_12255, partial [Phycisphaerae bacterium]